MTYHFNSALKTYRITSELPEGPTSTTNEGGYICERLVLSDNILMEASELYSNHYGFWICEDIGRGTQREGARVKLSPRRLLEGYLFNDDYFITHVHHRVSGILMGYAFGLTAPDPTSPPASGKKIAWITQLVVHDEYRSQGIAGRLIGCAMLAIQNISVFGIISSHPWAVLALMRVAGIPTPDLDLDFISQHGAACLRAVGVPYATEDMLVGSAFGKPCLDDRSDAPNLVSLALTNFHVEHGWCSRIIEFEKKRGWPLGDLPEAHEFFVVVRKAEKR
ncbi:hypothetical protein BD410DRAFT_153131 [Rickenella mellea]|uniref:N-acetyltransferase domain-containing protein n=1 Tax=Rickenella mellea TaxID=50990 RepID=A0A4Y7Q9S9_9AGAM|nr:hypothetical protein BD410DRAFT_153131 [Rickenella mellea]